MQQIWWWRRLRTISVITPLIQLHFGAVWCHWKEHSEVLSSVLPNLNSNERWGGDRLAKFLSNSPLRKWSKCSPKWPKWPKDGPKCSYDLGRFFLSQKTLPSFFYLVLPSSKSTLYPSLEVYQHQRTMQVWHSADQLHACNDVIVERTESSWYSKKILLRWKEEE